MIDLIVLWGLPLLGVLLGLTVALVVKSLSGPGGNGALFDLVAFDRIDVTDMEARKDFLDQYFGKLDHYVRQAKDSILVLDYLAHHRSLNAQDNEDLTGRYKQYFKTIEEVALRHNLTYTRIAQLPLPRIEEDREEKIAECLSLMFFETFEHVERMMRSSADFRFYVLDAAFRPYSLMVIDDELLITEYDRFNAQGKSEADHLIVNRAGKKGLEVSSKVTKLLQTQVGWCRRLVRRDRPVQLQEFLAQASRIERKQLREMEVRLVLSQDDFRRILAGNPLDEGMVRDVRFYGPEDVRKNVLGTQKKLRLIKEDFGSDEGMLVV